jgi:hypothetical protein
MGRHFSVKLPLACVAWIVAIFSGAAARAEDLPDARELLKNARVIQAEQEWALKGQLRVGSNSQPFRLVMENGKIEYTFLDNGDTITLKLGDKGSTLEEKRNDKTSKVTGARLAAKVRTTDISYEDIALPFLYWKDAKVVDSEMKASVMCWKLEVRPPAKDASQYGKVCLWISKENGGLMNIESYDENGKWSRRYTVRAGMMHKGTWLLKTMRIESADGRKSDPQPTYLEIDKVEKGPGQ